MATFPRTKPATACRRSRARSILQTPATGGPWPCWIRRRLRFSAPAPRPRSRPGTSPGTICGCGEQGRIQLAALRHVLNLQTAFAWDADADLARAFARRMAAETGIAVEAVDDLQAATRASDAIVTC